MSANPRRLGVPAQLMLGSAMGLSNVLGYLVVILLSRALGPDTFGSFSALNSIGIVLSIPATAFQILTARRVSRRGPESADLRTPFFAGLVITGSGLALAPVLLNLTRGTDILAPVLLALSFAPFILNGAMMGALLGLNRIRRLAFVYLFQGAAKLLAAFLTGLFDLDIAGAFGLLTVAIVLTALLAWCLSRDRLSLSTVRAPGASALDSVRSVGLATSSMGALVALISLDVVLARYLLPGVQSGEYALVSTLGRAPVWATQFLALTLVPGLARTGSTRSILRSAVLVLAICLAGTSVAALSPEFWVTLLGGDQFAGGASLLLPYLALGTLLSLAQCLVYAEMAQGRHVLTIVILSASILEVVLCLTWLRNSPGEILLAATIATATAVAVGFLILIRSQQKSGLVRRSVPG